jgi:predicted butyrate kinase (DUF1464 family)
MIAGTSDLPAEAIAATADPRARLAWEAYLESAAKVVASLALSAPAASRVILSGRAAKVPGLGSRLASLLARAVPNLEVETATGFATVAKHAAQGAALIADGLAGGTAATLVEALGIRDARGTVLDHLHVISAGQARRRLGMSGGD